MHTSLSPHLRLGKALMRMCQASADVFVSCICSWTECNMEVNLEMQGDWMKVNKGLPVLSAAT